MGYGCVDSMINALPAPPITETIFGLVSQGIFVGSSAAINIAGPGVLVSYTLGGLLVFFIMRMLGEMAHARPGLGSFAEYAAIGLGQAAENQGSEQLTDIAGCDQTPDLYRR